MIKYECDVCGTLNNAADTYGEGVINDHLQTMLWWREKKGEFHDKHVVLSILPGVKLEDGRPPHVCGKCTRDMLMEMIEEKWPTPDLETLVIEYDKPQEHVNHDDTPRDRGEDHHVPEVPAERAGDESSATEHCPSCDFPGYSPPGTKCEQRNFHVYDLPPRRVRDNPQA